MKCFVSTPMVSLAVSKLSLNPGIKSNESPDYHGHSRENQCMISKSPVGHLSIGWMEMEGLPCVTKLPKFRPTMQCHVAPLLESNCLSVKITLNQSLLCNRTEIQSIVSTHLLLDVLRNVLCPEGQSQPSCLLWLVPTFSMLNLFIASVAVRPCQSSSKVACAQTPGTHQLQLLPAACPRSVTLALACLCAGGRFANAHHVGRFDLCYAVY